MKHVRVLGPARAETQMKFHDGCQDPRDRRRLSENRAVWRIRPRITLVGPEGSIELTHGERDRRAQAYSYADIAEQLELNDGDSVFVETSGIRPTLFRNVLVRISPNYSYEMHIDTDGSLALGRTEKLEIY